ncbi:MAG: hypothetical protein ACR2MY_00660 [Candidatus Dormibacteria bacterium]
MAREVEKLHPFGDVAAVGLAMIGDGIREAVLLGARVCGHAVEVGGRDAPVELVKVTWAVHLIWPDFQTEDYYIQGDGVDPYAQSGQGGRYRDFIMLPDGDYRGFARITSESYCPDNEHASAFAPSGCYSRGDGGGAFGDVTFTR